MDLIDRDELELDTEWSDYYDGYMSYSQSQINGAVEVQAIPLGKVKQAREEIEHLSSYGKETYYRAIDDVLAILDELIESEG